MARQRFDIGSKWMLHNQGKGTLLLGGIKGVSRVEPMPGEIVQNRRLPDGLLQVFFRREPKPYPMLIEVATYPEKRALRQAMDDLTLAFSALGHLPELLMLVLRPKGKFRLSGTHEVHSPLGLSRLEANWKVIELATLSAAEFLAVGDVGVVPWVPLMQFDGPPERLLERCAEWIEREAPLKYRTDMLVVSQVMTTLRFSDPNLLSIFTGATAMIESPLIQQWKAEAIHELIVDTLKDRFSAVPRDVTKHLRAIVDQKKLRQLNRIANKCPDLQAFRDALPS